MNRSSRTNLATVIGLGALLASGSWAIAQQRAGSDGRALDANQQVGSAGVNPADGRLDFSRQNDIITGNVGGGRGFQDDVGYGAVGEFQDSLGSDSLFDFRAQSLSSSPSYLNAASVGGVSPQSNISVYRSFTNRAAQPRQSVGLVAPDGGTFQLVPTASLYSTPGGRYSSLFRTPSPSSQSPGLALQSFSSAPTLGLRGQLAPTQALNRRLYEQAHEANALEPPPSMIVTPSYNTRLFDPLGSKDSQQVDLENLQVGQIPPSLLLGKQLQDQLDPLGARQDDGDPRNQQLLDSVFRPLKRDQDTAEQADPYLRLLRAIRDTDGRSDGADVAGWDNPLDEPTTGQVTEAERAYAKIMEELYGEDYAQRMASRAHPDEDDQADQDESAADVVARLNYDLPRLETLASNKKTRIARLTREAEAALANGKYLSAEARYRQIILDTKDDPLPRMGLVHAQLGAGMFRSAGMNLRALFSQHPELIAARYDAKLLPPQSRLQWVQQELQTAISQGEGGKDAPVLLAYLGYQASSRQVIRYGLALAQAQSPRDPLLALLREIWLDQADPVTESSPEPADGN